ANALELVPDLVASWAAIRPALAVMTGASRERFVPPGRRSQPRSARGRARGCRRPRSRAGGPPSPAGRSRRVAGPTPRPGPRLPLRRRVPASSRAPPPAGPSLPAPDLDVGDWPFVLRHLGARGPGEVPHSHRLPGIRGEEGSVERDVANRAAGDLERGKT